MSHSNANANANANTNISSQMNDSSHTDGGGHLTQHAHLINTSDRYKYIKQKGQVLWLTGLSGSGKSTLAMACEYHLLQNHKIAFVLDGDHTRSGLCKDLGFSLSDRNENVRRVAHCAHLMAQSGVITFVCLISPTQASRDMARSICHSTPFHEVFLDTSLKICEERDPKGLYRKARSGLITNFTGVSSPYEIPKKPEFVVDQSWDINASITHLIHYLRLDQ